MGKLLQSRRAHRRVYDNSVSAFNPQFWANESLAILEENMVVGNLVHRDFEPIVQNYGDTVNTRRIGEFTAVRKGAVTDNVTVQDATATNVQVVLNQHIHVSFLIRDGEESKSVTSLVDEYMAPAMIAEARYIDKVLSGQVYQFLGNHYGRLGVLASSDVVDRITGVRNLMNVNKAPMDGRNLILTPTTETTFLRNGDFTNADKVGDNGTALRTASLGNLYGFNNFMAQNQSSVTSGNTTVTGAVNLSAGYAAGTTTMTVDGLSAAIANGTWFTVAGDNTPLRVVSTVGAGTPTSITFTPALTYDVANDAVITLYTPGQVNLSGGYAAGYGGTIAVDTFSVAPKTGQLVAFGTATDYYSVLSATTTTLILDRPLEAAIADDAKVAIGPVGEYNFALRKNALCMVVRPLALPRAGLALGAVVNLNGLSIRAVITYDGTKQGHLVTLDMLMGTKVLDALQGAVLLG